MNSLVSLIATALGFLSAGLLIGDGIGTNREKQSCRASIATRAAAVAQAQSQRLQEANALGDSLTRRLNVAEAVIHQTQQERDRALKNLTSGRACLSAGAVGLLNDPRRGSADVPQTTGQPDATDGDSATDTDVAWWIGVAQEQYETCRGRLNALIDFEGGRP